MHSEQLEELIKHLRQIHFFLILASIACLSIIYGYKDSRIDTALVELQDFLNVPPRMLNVSSDLTLEQAKIRWNQLTRKLKTTNVHAMSAPNVPVDMDDVPLPTLTATYDFAIDGCAGWENISRFEYESFEKEMRQKGLASVDCGWIGEDQLLVVAIEIPDVPMWQVTAQGTASIDKEKVRYRSFQEADSPADLGSCGRWQDIQRSEYQSFTDEMFKNTEQSIWCVWTGENELVYWSGSMDRHDEIYLVTPNGVTATERVQLFSSSAQRASFDNLNRCGGVAPGNVDEWSQALDGKGAGEAGRADVILCFWSQDTHLVVFDIDWQQNTWVGEQYRDKVGYKFSRIYPNLAALEADFLDDPLDTAVDRDSAITADDSLNSIRGKLNRQLVRLEDTSIAGIPLKQNVVLYGGPPLLVLLQLYFFLHFRQLLFRAPPDKGTAVAWIGAYTDGVSRTVFALTAVVVPPACLILLAQQRIVPQVALTAAICAASVAIAVLQAIAIRAVWRDHLADA